MNCDLCDGRMVICNTGLMCNKCGVTATHFVFQEPFNVDNTFTHKTKATIYKRIKYFTKIIKNIRGRIIPLGITNELIISKIKNKPFETIHELRKLFQTERLSKYYDFIFYYWHKLKHERLIKLSEDDQKKLQNKFITFELAFRSKYPYKRNIINYNYLIRRFFKEINKEDYCQYLKPMIVSERINKLNKIYKKVNNLI